MGITFLLSKLKISTAVRIVQLVLTFVNSELIKLFLLMEELKKLTLVMRIKNRLK